MQAEWIPGAVVSIIFVVVDVERQSRVFNPRSFIDELHVDAPLLIHFYKMRKLCDATAAERQVRKYCMNSSASSGAAVWSLVALKQDPFEAFKVPKLVKMRKVLSAPAAEVQEYLAACLLVQIQRLELKKRDKFVSYCCDSAVRGMHLMINFIGPGREAAGMMD
jgi:hypothetical protein